MGMPSSPESSDEAGIQVMAHEFMDLPEDVLTNIFQSLVRHNIEALVAIQCSSKRLCSLVDKALLLPGAAGEEGSDISPSASTFLASKRKKLAWKSWKAGGWDDRMEKLFGNQYLRRSDLSSAAKEAVFCSMDVAVCYNAEMKYLGVLKLRKFMQGPTTPDSSGWAKLASILLESGNITSLYVTIDEDIERRRSVGQQSVLWPTLIRHELEKLVLPVFCTFDHLNQLLQTWPTPVHNWYGLTKLDISRPEWVADLDFPGWEDGLAVLLSNLPNLAFFAARNTPTGLKSLMALAATCTDSILHIDLRGCKAVGAPYAELEPGHYTLYLGCFSNLQSLMVGGTHIVGFFTCLADDVGTQRVVANLTMLDISDPEMGAASSAALLETVALLLQTAVSLRSLSAGGLKGIAGLESLLLERLVTAGSMAALFSSNLAAIAAACRTNDKNSLLHLSAGWGFGSAMLRMALWGSEFLTSLTIGLGAQINDSDLEAVSVLCPHLQRLVLRFATVSDIGVSKVVRACRSLTVLQLMHCSGPFGDDLGAAFIRRRPLLQLKELCIVGGAQDLTDQALERCLARKQARLQSLELGNCWSLTSQSLYPIRLHVKTLEHLKLVNCNISSSASGTDLLGIVELCLKLRSLTLRHCATFKRTDLLLDITMDHHTLLREICLDTCDVDPSAIKVQIEEIARHRCWRDAIKVVDLHCCRKHVGKGGALEGAAEGSSSQEEIAGQQQSELLRYDLSYGIIYSWDWKQQAWMLKQRDWYKRPDHPF